MAPSTRKRKINDSHYHYDLTDASTRFPASLATLDTLLANGLPEEMRVLQPFLESISQAASLVSNTAGERNYLPSRLTMRVVREKLGIDFTDEKTEYFWSLTDDQKEHSASKPLATWAVTAIEKLKDSQKMSSFRREPSIRTLFDILLADRLDQLDDSDADSQLLVGYEVPMTATIKQERGGGKIPGRADWSLGYMDDIDKLEQMLVVIEAKTEIQHDSNMAQLLAYLYSVHDARVKRKKDSSAVFGVLTDFKVFRFVVLRENAKAMQSVPLQWATHSAEIVAFLDNILLGAIKSSPHTTPHKTANKTIRNYDRHLKSTYNMGEESGATGHEEEEEEEDDDVFDVVKIDGVSILVPHQQV